jgi:hypothetical protein
MLDRVAHSGPRVRRRGGAESAIAEGLLRVRHAAPDSDATLGGAPQVPQTGVRDGRICDIDGHM